MKQLKLIPTIVVKYILRACYGFFCLLFKVDRYKVIFASYRSEELKDNLAFIDRQIAKDYPEYKRHYFFKKFDGSLSGKLKYLVHMINACYHLATSRYFIIDDYYFPIYVIKPRKGMEIIQLWHSAGALKKFGHSTVGKPFGPSEDYLKHVNIHGNYTKAYVSSSEVIPYFADAFNMKDTQIHPLGVPRTDYFFDDVRIVKLRKRFYEEFPSLIGKKLLLYAPTFRGKSHYQGKFELPFDLNYIAENLQDDYALIIHLHPYMQKDIKLNDDGFAYHLQNTYTIQDLSVLADILITDYSTVFFDFSLLERPSIFYPYDLEEYKRERDFYYNYEDLVPGPIVTDTGSLVKLIQDGSFDMERVMAFRDQFFDYQDGRAAERIVEDVFGGNYSDKD